MGVAKGIFPGRVAWVRDANATYWDTAWNDRKDIHYWDDSYTDANVVEEMMSKSLCRLTGEVTDKAAWDKLFRQFNKTHGNGDVGYTSGQKIAIKPNCVEQKELATDPNNFAGLSPQMVLALLKQLVWEAGVDPCCITICDSARYIADKIFLRCYALFPEVHYNVTNFYDSRYHRQDDRYNDYRRPPVQPSPEPLIHYSGLKPDGNPVPSDYMPMPFVDANYVISLAIMKCHSQAGVTLSGKNWYGSCCITPGDNKHIFLNIKTTQSPEYNHYRLMVDLMGYEHLGGKTMLFIIDGLFGFPAETGAASKPVKWSFFNNDFPSSIFMSQDHVAIDSVALDFLLAEFSGSGIIISKGAIDDYLHEAALANDPCSGTFYDPEGDGTRLQSLGAHEHWNNSTGKKYSRNLGTGAGIELVSSPTTKLLGPLDGDVDNNYSVNFADLLSLAQGWLEIRAIDSNLVAWYNLDESSGGTAYDLSGNHYDGTLLGGSAFEPTGGYLLGAVRFEGNAERVEVPTAGISTAAGTISLWDRLEGPQTQMFRFFFGDRSGTGSDTNRIQLYMKYNTNLNLGLADQHQLDTDIMTLNTDQWYHIAMTWGGGSGNEYVVYVDGVEKTRGTHNTIGALSPSANIGNSGEPTPVGGFFGLIDEVGIYNRVLNANEIMQIYQGLPPANLSGDLNKDCKIDFNDFALMAKDWGRCNIMPQVFQAGFEDCNLAGWQATDSNAWRIEDGNGGNPGKALSLYRQSSYSPPYRSPNNIILLPDVNVGSFVMELNMLSTKAYYAGRDLCVFFGYQNPSHFYYAHIADVNNSTHNSIFIVNGADRTSIANYQNGGNSWEGGWHTVRLIRNVDKDAIEVFFDNMSTPVMTAIDGRFKRGKVGVGSFDDTGQFDNIRVWGR
jgi:uncharacterized protein (DUF362 family)